MQNPELSNEFKWTRPIAHRATFDQNGLLSTRTYTTGRLARGRPVDFRLNKPRRMLDKSQISLQPPR